MSLVRTLVVMCAAACVLVMPAAASAWTAEVIAGGKRGFTPDGKRGKIASIYAPTTVAPDRRGGYYFTDSWNHRVRHVSSKGKLTTVAGSGHAPDCGENKPALEVCLALPHGVAVGRKGELLVTDTFNHRVFRVGRDGIARTIAGSGKSCTPGQTHLCGEGGPALEADLHLPIVAKQIGDEIFIADTAHRILKVSGGKVERVAGTGEWGHAGDGGPANSARIFAPADMVAYKGGLLISDGNNCRLRWIDPKGIIHPFAGGGSLKDCWDSYGLVPEENWYGGWGGPVADVRDGGSAANGIMRVTGFLATDGDAVWVTDFLNSRIRQIKNGRITTIAGTGQSPGVNGPGPMPASKMRLGWPSGLAMIDRKTLLLGDSGNDRIVLLRR